MTIIHEIRLEIVRAGPSHNQLLSPLTRYMALCGDSEPITFSIDLEQHQLLDVLSRLRYYQREDDKNIAVSKSEREAAVSEMGRRVGDVFAVLTNLLVEQGRALGVTTAGQAADQRQLVHLRLISSASELAYVPFEMAISPPAAPSEGSPMFIDKNLPIVISREIRRSRPVPISWASGKPPKVLLIAAEPGFLRVPLEQHIAALRNSLKPWIKRVGTDYDPVNALKERLRVLPDATLPKIYELCSKEKFTHVHILAHGGQYTRARETRYGLILCDDQDNTKKHYVSGNELAQALQAEGEDASWRSSPQMVTLATCDSGAQGSLLTPGGSIAHDLHLAGLPVVVASQFPLTKAGSVTLTESLYPRILRGDDPRSALFEVRRKLASLNNESHDWASIIVYASLPEDFDRQVNGFFESQCKAAIDVALGQADSIAETVKGLQDNTESTVDKKTLSKNGRDALHEAIEVLDLWRSRLITGSEMHQRVRRAEHFGMCGSTYKRIALFYKRVGNESEYIVNLQRSLAHYKLAVNEWAMEESKYHWAATQLLSLRTILSINQIQTIRAIQALSNENDANKTPEAASREQGPLLQFEVSREEVAMYLMAREFAERDATQGGTEQTRAWGFGSLAELEMISIPFEMWKTDRDVSLAAITKAVGQHCKKIVDCVGPNHFAVDSTLRQLERYTEFWRGNKEYPLEEFAGEGVRVLRYEKSSGA